MKQFYPDLYPQQSQQPHIPTPPDLRTVSPVVLPDEITDKPLSKKSVDEVCDLIRKIDGLMVSRIDSYCDTLSSQNVSGAVLAHCNIQELKSVLGMNFGDWEIFHLVLVSLRNHEKKRKHSFMVVKARPQKAPQKAESLVSLANPVSSANSSMRTPSRKVSTSAAETAITMEDALISGLLSTLNEDAHEDILTDELMDGKRSRHRSRSFEADNEESDVIYISRSKGAIMTQSVGSEDAFNALERGSAKGSTNELFQSIGGSAAGSLADVSNLVAFDSQTTSPTKATVTHTTSVYVSTLKSLLEMF